MTIQELFSDASKWCKVYYAKDKEGRGTGPNVVDAVCWCLEGAIRKCYVRSEIQQVKEKLAVAAQQLFPKRRGSSIVFNDDPETTFEDVRKLVELADV